MWRSFASWRGLVNLARRATRYACRLTECRIMRHRESSLTATAAANENVRRVSDCGESQG